MMRTVLIALALVVATPATAQSRASPVGQGDRVGQVAKSSVGAVGQRRTREQAAPNIAPLGRITSRVQNRVQSRIRNRIDRHYDPRVNATSPFEIAGEQARRAGRPSRR
jgi:hypothetical protein